MATDPNAALFEDPQDLARLADLIRQEVEALAEVHEEAEAKQWETSPVPRPRDDTAERSKGGHSDPTPSIALDGRRLRLRAQVIASERIVREALVAVRGVRLGLERSLVAWRGEE